MARRTNRRSAPRRAGPTEQGPSLGAHWRADGTPKAAYVSQGEALAVADERRAETGADLSVYRCELCSAWHMGNAGGRHER
jgi:hypothetical protein